jgi:hypothetical protein
LRSRRIQFIRSRIDFLLPVTPIWAGRRARELITRLRAITSVFNPDTSYLRNLDRRELYLSGLRLAAGETV